MTEMLGDEEISLLPRGRNELCVMNVCLSVFGISS
jgi:hypothetical protein